jgi:hypothetical protein
MEKDKTWGVWNAARQGWLLGPSMTEHDAQKAARVWNNRANPGERFEAKKDEKQIA